MVAIFLVVMLLNLVGVVVCHNIAKSRGQRVIFWTTMGVAFGVLAIPFALRTNKSAQEAVTMSSVSPVSIDKSGNAGAHTAKRSRFMMAMSWVLLAVVLVGFSPSFYLRSFFPAPPIPSYIYVHGAVSTCWFLLLVAQTTLVATGNTATHRKLGVVGILLGVLIVVPGFWFILKFPSRILKLTGAPPEALLPRLTEGVAVGLVVAVLTGAFLLAAFLNYKKPQLHRRLIMLASITMVSAAFTRIGGLPIFGGINFHIVMFSGVFALVSALWLYDITSSGNVHIASLTGGTILLLSHLLAINLVPQFASWQAFVKGLL
jgi:hypothetical protein